MERGERCCPVASHRMVGGLLLAYPRMKNAGHFGVGCE